MSSCEGPGCTHPSHKAGGHAHYAHGPMPEEDLVGIALRAPYERAERERAEALEAARARRRAIAVLPKYAIRAQMILAMTPEQFEAWAAEHPADIARIRAAMEKRARRERQKDWRDWMARACSGKEVAKRS